MPCSPPTGYYGAAYVFTGSGASWARASTLTYTNGVQASSENLGSSVALSGDGTVALVGAPGMAVPPPSAPSFDENDQGAALVYTTANNWSTASAPSLLTAGATDSFVGTSVALSSAGTTALVGAPEYVGPGSASNGSGAAYIFTGAGGTWGATPVTTLSAIGGATGDEFGGRVALSGDGTVALVSAFNKPAAAGTDVGAAYSYNSVSGSWSGVTQETADITPSDGQQGENFGFSVALSNNGTQGLIGGLDYAKFTYENVGAAYLFTPTAPPAPPTPTTQPTPTPAPTPAPQASTTPSAGPSTTTSGTGSTSTVTITIGSGTTAGKRIPAFTYPKSGHVLRRNGTMRLTVRLTGSSGAVTGRVVVRLGAHLVCNPRISRGTATCVLVGSKLPKGHHTLTIRFGGSSLYTATVRPYVLSVVA